MTDSISEGREATTKIAKQLLKAAGVKAGSLTEDEEITKEDLAAMTKLLKMVTLGLEAEGKNYDTDDNVDRVRMYLLQNYLDDESSLYDRGGGWRKALRLYQWSFFIILFRLYKCLKRAALIVDPQRSLVSAFICTINLFRLTTTNIVTFWSPYSS